jgi:hypothetical protein
MAEATNQVTEFQREWAAQQQKLMSDWLEALEGFGPTTPPKAWRKTVDLMEQQVTGALDAQKRSLLAMAENAENIEGAPEPVTQWFQQLEEGVELWTDVQERLWKVWFDMLRTTVPAAQTPGETLMKNWEDMVHRAMSVQEEWLSRLTDSGTAHGKKHAKSAPASQASAGAHKH